MCLRCLAPGHGQANPFGRCRLTASAPNSCAPANPAPQRAQAGMSPVPAPGERPLPASQTQQRLETAPTPPGASDRPRGAGSGGLMRSGSCWGSGTEQGEQRDGGWHARGEGTPTPGRSGVPAVLDEVAAEGDVSVVLIAEDGVLALALVEPHPDLVLLAQLQHDALALHDAAVAHLGVEDHHLCPVAHQVQVRLLLVPGVHVQAEVVDPGDVAVKLAREHVEVLVEVDKLRVEDEGLVVVVAVQGLLAAHREGGVVALAVLPRGAHAALLSLGPRVAPAASHPRLAELALHAPLAAVPLLAWAKQEGQLCCQRWCHLQTRCPGSPFGWQRGTETARTPQPRSLPGSAAASKAAAQRPPAQEQLTPRGVPCPPPLPRHPAPPSQFAGDWCPRELALGAQLCAGQAAGAQAAVPQRGALPALTFQDGHVDPRQGLVLGVGEALLGRLAAADAAGTRGQPLWGTAGRLLWRDAAEGRKQSATGSCGWGPEPFAVPGLPRPPL